MASFEDTSDMNDPFPYHTSFRDGRRNSMLVLCANSSSTFEVRERDILGSNPADQSLMKDAANFAKYAQIIYVSLKKLVVDEFMVGPEATHFKRDAESLSRHEFRLTSIGCEHAMLCYASFANGMATTPYAILVDDKVKKILITVRGTLSLDDIVANLQYNSVSLEKTGKVCGFEGEGHCCHKGFLTRAKWLYNDIKK